MLLMSIKVFIFQLICFFFRILVEILSIFWTIKFAVVGNTEAYWSCHTILVPIRCMVQYAYQTSVYQLVQHTDIVIGCYHYGVRYLDGEHWWTLWYLLGILLLIPLICCFIDLVFWVFLLIKYLSQCTFFKPLRPPFIGSSFNKKGCSNDLSLFFGVSCRPLYFATNKIFLKNFDRNFIKYKHQGIYWAFSYWFFLFVVLLI